MTDRYKGLQVTFSQDIRADDAQALIEAIKMLRGVQDVRPIIADPWEDSTIEIRIKARFRQRILEALSDDTP